MTAMIVVVVAVVTVLSSHREEQSYRSELKDQAAVMLNALESDTADHLDRSLLPSVPLELAHSGVVVSARVYDSGERYRHIVDQAGDIIYQTNFQGRFTLINPAAIRMTEYTEQELIGPVH